MIGWMTRTLKWVRRPRTRGQALAEFSLLLMALLVIGGGIASFAPDMFAAFTIYVRGFYLVLGYPLG
ncbi:MULTISPECIES: hypothetical protein [Myxococcus]|uniref:Uncharacterized protein n=1 Tax=Myxococcus xanthus TaxID=34 RepID=A0AAE6FWK1_MYXXA|nr:MULTISPECIES: hypothetical protein [Myxococcus]QDE66239.1 hypothetical protein BHS09_04075 [Myxococcus xanthus]QDE73512.1 hypothetical protein BHS08_04080 [Myxococcus xanthus]QDE80786.1 hypothetical protein BHS07_04025 [Myxococcus xanthus]QDE95106.1 hypothetical protein BHS05_04095 [Myxococcus xanthus]QDF02382.1 hypothetical protein BHS04_04050 [Myxococcus xanthus]